MILAWVLRSRPRMSAVARLLFGRDCRSPWQRVLSNFCTKPLRNELTLKRLRPPAPQSFSRAARLRHPSKSPPEAAHLPAAMPWPSRRIPSADDGGRPPPADLNGQVSVSLAGVLYLDANNLGIL